MEIEKNQGMLNPHYYNNGLEEKWKKRKIELTIYQNKYSSWVLSIQITLCSHLFDITATPILSILLYMDNINAKGSLTFEAYGMSNYPQF